MNRTVTFVTCVTFFQFAYLNTFIWKEFYQLNVCYEMENIIIVHPQHLLQSDLPMGQHVKLSDVSRGSFVTLYVNGYRSVLMKKINRCAVREAGRTFTFIELFIFYPKQLTNIALNPKRKSRGLFIAACYRFSCVARHSRWLTESCQWLDPPARLSRRLKTKTVCLRLSLDRTLLFQLSVSFSVPPAFLIITLYQTLQVWHYNLSPRILLHQPHIGPDWLILEPWFCSASSFLQ